MCSLHNTIMEIEYVLLPFLSSLALLGVKKFSWNSLTHTRGRIWFSLGGKEATHKTQLDNVSGSDGREEQKPLEAHKFSFRQRAQRRAAQIVKMLNITFAIYYRLLISTVCLPLRLAANVRGKSTLGRWRKQKNRFQLFSIEMIMMVAREWTNLGEERKWNCSKVIYSNTLNRPWMLSNDFNYIYTVRLISFAFHCLPSRFHTRSGLIISRSMGTRTFVDCANESYTEKVRKELQIYHRNRECG